MKKYGIKSRGRLGLTKPIKISKEKLEYLYHDRKLSAVKIAKILHRSKGGYVAKAKRGTFEIVAHLNKTFSFLLPKQDNIETWILVNPPE